MSSQLNTIENLAESLVEFCKEPNNHEQSILQIINDLGTELLSNLAEKNIDIACSILFKDNGPFFSFLIKCRPFSSGDLASAVSKALQILSTFIKARQVAFQKYAGSLMNIAKSIAKSGGNATAKNSAFDVLLVLLDGPNKYDATEFDIAGTYKMFQDEYVVKGTPTVKAKIVELLGEIARYYPNVVQESEINRLKRWCFDNLTSQTSKPGKFEYSTSQGYLNCLNSLIYRKDIEIVPKNSADSEKLFRIILKILNGMLNTNRYGTPIAALSLFYHHTRLFSNLLLPNCEQLYTCLYAWAGHHNMDAYKFGLLAFEEYIRQLSTVLYHNIQGERELQTFYTFMTRFNIILEQADSVDDMYKVSIAIRSVGYFAKIFTKVKNTDVEALRKSLVKISEWLYSGTNSNQVEYVRHLPAFIKAYTSFAQTMSVIPDNLLNTLHHMCQVFIEWIPHATGYLRKSGCSNLYQLLLMLYKKGEGIGRSFANTLFEKALKFTAINIQIPNEEVEPVYRKLLYFWKVVLDKPQYTSLFGIRTIDDDEDSLYPDKDDKPTADMKKELLNMLYDVFIANMIKIIKQLNLKVVDAVDSEKEPMDDEFNENVNVISKSLRPVNRSDFILFQNLVDFWSAIARDINNKRLVHWVYIFGSSLIESSILHPMVSGFYRMMSEILVICEKEQLFAGCEAYFSNASNQVTATGSNKPAEYTTYLVYREYLKEVWHRLQQFTDELLASSLRLILAYPTEFFDLTELITPLEKALRLGVTYHPLATVAMNSLDKLLDPNLGYDIDSNFLSRILPCINEYLLIGVVNFSEQEEVKTTFKPQTSAQRRYMTVHTKTTSDEIGVVKQDYANLPDLQRRMMQFLGRLGGKNKQLLSQGKDAIEDNGMLAWDPVKKLKLRVPFMNVKVNIYLDEFLPRICELAESSPDRQVKIAACELLHGLVVYMIGNSAFAAKTSKASSESLYHKYYERVFPVMLKLAIDADPIARDMYRFFYAQIIHWLTNNAHADNPETLALLQSLLDASCDADAGLRDYGAECIQEFVIWSIKQTSRSTDGAQNIKSLLKRLYNLMSSSSASKRFGASLVFNRIYRQFREESALVDEYTIEILGQLFLSLKMAEDDHPSIGTRAQITEAINHITKIIERKADVFLKENHASRRPFIGDNEVIALPQLVRWAFMQGGSLQRNYVKLCISFFSKFVLLLPGIKSAKEWVAKELHSDPNFLVDIYETRHLNPPSMLSEDQEVHIVYLYSYWLKRLNSTLDAYIWLIERKIVDPKEVLEAESSNLLYALAFFIRNKPADFLEEKLNVNLAEKSKILSISTYISVRIVYFFDLVFGPLGGDGCFRYVERVFSDTLYHSNIMDIISQALILPKNTSETIQPHQDNAITQSGVKRTFKIAQNFIATMLKKSATFMEQLSLSIGHALIANHVDLALDTLKAMERSTLIELGQTIPAIKYIQSIDALDRVCQKAVQINDRYPPTALRYCEYLFKNFLHYCKLAREPLFIKLLGNMLVISFSHTGFAEANAAELLTFSIPAKPNANKEKIEIFQKFDRYIAECVATHMDVFTKLFKQYLELARDPEEDIYKTIHGLILSLLDFLESNRLNERKLVWQFTDYLIKDDSLLATIITRWNKSDPQLLDIISCLKRLFGADPTLLSRSKGKHIYKVIWDVFVSFLRSEKFGVRLAALDLLPVFLCLDTQAVQTVMKELQISYINKLPPVQGKEYIKEGTMEYNVIISTLDKLLVPMVTFKSVALFDLLKVTFIQEEHHIHEDAIKSSIEKFSHGLGLTSFLGITQSLMEFFKNAEYNIEHRNNIAQILLVLLKSANQGHVVEFFKKHLCFILGLISDDKDRDNCSTDELYMKGICLCFMQAYFNLLPKEIVDTGSQLDLLWSNSDENMDKTPVKQHIIKSFKTVVTKDLSNAETLAPERREAVFSYNREVVNTFAVYALRISDNQKVYNSFFNQLKRDHSKKAFIWQDLIDPNQFIHLEAQLSKPLVRKRLARHSQSTANTAKEGESIYYMESIDVMGSSLIQSTFSEVVLEESQKPQEDVDVGEGPSTQTPKDIVMASVESEDTESSQDDDIEDFEVDVLNDNTFMPIFTEMIKQLHLNIFPPTETAVEPAWMSSLRAAFQEFGNGDNSNGYSRDYRIKLQVYIAKLISNYPEAFEKYAANWILPLLQFVVKGNQFGDPINYLVQDICIILIIWGKNNALPTTQDASKILYNCINYLMENAFHPNHRVLRSNIQLIKGIYENWGKSCHVPTKTIYKQFHHQDREAYKNTIGLQLVGIVFSNGVFVYDNHEESDLFDLPEDKFFDDLAANLAIRGRSGAELRNNAAELMGWSLKFMKERGSRCYEDMRETFREKFINLANDKSVTLTNYFKCINRMYLHDLEMGKSIVNNVALRLYYATQEEKIMGLEFINACYNQDEMIYHTLKRSGLNRFFSSKDVALQIAALKMVNTMFDDMDGESIGSIFRIAVQLFPNHKNAECRALFYSFVKKTYACEKFKEKVKIKAKAQIFKGLIDKEQSIAHDIFNFVTQDLQVDDNIRATLLKITGEMYVSETEDIYLLYATRMILENTKKTYDFNEPIFPNPLTGAKSDASYRDIDTAWHSSSSMQPLFVDSRSKSKKLDMDDIDMQLRKTQTLMEFSHTVGGSQSLVSTFNPASQALDFDEGDPGTDLESQLKKKVVKKERPYYRPRFVDTTQAAVNRFHANRVENLRKNKETLLNFKDEANEKKVSMTRSYREGEIPDVQISHKDLLLPLEVLATADHNISRLLYSSLAVSIVNEMKEAVAEQDLKEYQDELVKMISKNLTMSQIYFTPTIGSFLRIIFELGASIPALLVKTASSKSDNHHIGIAILEKQLMFGDSSERPTKRSSSLTPTQQKWIHLSLLYQYIDELEIFENVYLANVASNNWVRDALRSQIDGNFATAFNLYDKALETAGSSVDDTENSLWQEQMLFCRTQLGQWDRIGSDTRDATQDDWNSLWGDKEDPYLEYFVRSYAKAGKERVFTGKEWIEYNKEKDKKKTAELKTWVPERRAWLPDEVNPLFAFLDEAYKNPAHREKLLNKFACDWSMVEIYRKEYNLGRLFIGRSYDALLSSWTTLHPLAYTSRLGRLAQLQRTVETEDYLDLHKKIEDKNFTNADIQTFLKALQLRNPDTQNDRIDVWYEILLSRLQYLDDLKTSQIGDTSLIIELSVAKEQFVYVTDNTALKQNNLSILGQIRKFYDEGSTVKNLTYVRFLQSNLVQKEVGHKAAQFELLLKRNAILKPEADASIKQIYEHNLVIADSFDIMKQQFILDPTILEALLRNTEPKWKKFVSSKGLGPVMTDSSTFVNYLETQGFESLVKIEESIDGIASQRAEYLWKLGRYCDESLNVLQDESSTLKPAIDPVKYAEIVIKNYFEAMDLGHQEAANYFPRLLELMELYPATGETFKACSISISCIWRYIRWIPQLVSSINSSIAPYILPCLQRLAELYPNALYYPMQISCEIYELRKASLTEETRESIERIIQIIQSPMLSQFSNELKRLTDPAQIAKDFVAYIKSDLANKDVPQSFITSKYDEFYSLILNNYSERLGVIPKRHAAEFARHFIKYFGNKGEKIGKLTPKELNELELFCRSNLGKSAKNADEEKNLKSYSPWLNSFKSIDHELELEIPGQYEGLSKPYPELHAKVASIDPTLLVMQSMRRPKRIKIYGTDEMEYLFLVKGGEDLRLDERIEQAFGVMNDAVKQNKFCSSHSIQIATYKVIPMSSNSGLIEWVDNTKPLKSCMEEQTTMEQLAVPKQKYRRWITSNKRNAKALYERYHVAFNKPRETIVEKFKETQASVSADLIRNYLFKLASSPEAFLFSRKEFAYSLACISIFGYILGIGDRHMDNFLVDMKSGRLIPIDFGYAFGVATESLAIPEIVPFRLTRQLVSVLEPLGISGILEDAMTHIMTALQAEKELILNVLSVFVKEPHLEWKQAAKKQARELKRDNESEEGSSATTEKTNTIDQDIAWYPQEKLELVKRKLNKGNPAYITISDISSGHKGKAFYEGVVEIAKGSPTYDIRAQVGPTCKDTNEQIRCLINQATDPRVLGVGYEGWAPFF